MNQKSDYSDSLRPIPSHARYAGPFTMFWLFAGGNVLLASFIVGSSYFESLGFIPAVVATIVGNLAGYAVCAWSAQKNVKFGIDEATSHIPTFGVRGSCFGVFLIVLITIGWDGVLSSLIGSAGRYSISVLSGGFGFGGDSYIYAIGVGLIVPLALLIIDPKIGFKLSNITAPIMLLFSFYMLFKLLNAKNISAMLHFQATGDPGDTSWMYAFEEILSFAVVWLPYLGAWNRMSKSEKGGYWGTYLGLAFVGMLFGLIGGMATLLTGEVDPTSWMVDLNLGVIAFLAIVAGTITTITIITYAATMAVLSVFPKWKFSAVAASIIVVVLPFIFIGTLRDLFDYILIFGGMLAGPYWAIILIDYFFLRKEKINVNECFKMKGVYRYYKGAFCDVPFFQR